MVKGDGFEMEIARLGGPVERSNRLRDLSDEQTGFIPADIRGRGGHLKSKHVRQKGRDKTDQQTSLSLVDKQLLHLLHVFLSAQRLHFHLAHI